MSSRDEATDPVHAPIDPDLFRSVLGNFASGVTVVTALDDGVPVGLTAQSFTSLSLDPPLVMFCPKVSSTSWPRIERARLFAANILAEGQDALGMQFARSGADKFAGVAWSPGPAGTPLLDGALAYIECRIEAVHPGGDHQIVVGRVLGLDADPAKKPLVYFRSAFESLAPRG